MLGGTRWPLCTDGRWFGILLTDGEIKLLRECAEIHLGYLQREIEAGPDEELIGIQGNETIETKVLELLNRARENELRDLSFADSLDELVSTLTEKSGAKDSDMKKLLLHQLDSFAVRCGQDPGPDLDFYSSLRFQWDVSFDEKFFKDIVEEIDQQVSSGQLHRPIVKANVAGCWFDSSFKIEEPLRYSSGHNRFVLTCPEGFHLETDKDEIWRVFHRLSAVLKLIYGFNLGLGELRIVLASENGYNEIGLGLVDPSSRTRSSNQRTSPTYLIQLWPSISTQLKTIDKSVDSLLIRLRELNADRETDDFLIDLMTCFEMLFSDSQEIRFKLASRAAAFLGLIGISGSYSVILEAYKGRSELVHGSSGGTEEELSHLKDAIPKLLIYLRAAVLARLFFAGSKQAFIKQLDVVLKQLLDPQDITEAEKQTIDNFKEKVAKFANAVTIPLVPKI